MAKKDNENRKVLEVKFEGAKWEKAQDDAFKKNVANVTIDGFRKGKCPKDVFLKKYGKESLYMDAAESLGGDAYDEIAKNLEISVYDIALALDATKQPVSIFEPIYNDGGDTIYLYDQISIPEQDLDINLAVDEAIDNLEERERYIVEERYVTGKTQMELADELGISQAQVSRLEKSAINTLKKVLR